MFLKERRRQTVYHLDIKPFIWNTLGQLPAYFLPFTENCHTGRVRFDFVKSEYSGKNSWNKYWFY